jgi:hypothetical protein
VSTLPLHQHNALLTIVARVYVDAEVAQRTAERLQRDADALSAALYHGMTNEEATEVCKQLNDCIDRARRVRL